MGASSAFPGALPPCPVILTLGPAGASFLPGCICCPGEKRGEGVRGEACGGGEGHSPVGAAELCAAPVAAREPAH